MLTTITDRRYTEMVSKFGGLLLGRRPGRSWLTGKIADLGALLRQLPEDRQHAFTDTLNAPDASQGDDRNPDEAKST